MGRPPLGASARRTSVSVRFSAAELEKIDAARGTMKRSDFVRAAVGEKLARKASS